MNQRARRAGFFLVEVLVIVAVVVALALVFLRPPSGYVKAGRIKCVNNLKNVGLAFRIFATDNNDQFPGSILTSNLVDFASINVETIFGVLSNELSTPKILYCPEDKKRQPAESFTNFSSRNVSYFTSISAIETQPQAFLAGDRNIEVSGKLATGLLPLKSNLVVSWSKDIHIEQGNIAMGDGSVQQMSNSRLKNALHEMGSATNYLVFP
jgi:hypothetical protein